MDLTFTKSPTDFYSAIPAALLKEEGAHTLLVYFLTPMPIVKRALIQMGLPLDQVPDQAIELINDQCKTFSRLVHTADKPVVGYTFQGLDDPSIRGLIEQGIPVFPDPERAARAIGALVRYAGK